MGTRQVSIRLPEELHKVIETKADIDRVKFSEQVVKLLQKGVNTSDNVRQSVEQNEKERISSLEARLSSIEVALRTVEIALRTICTQIESKAFLEARETAEKLPSISAKERYQGIFTAALVRRLRCDKESLLKRRGNDEEIRQWTQERDPEGIGWIFRGKRYFPVLDNHFDIKTLEKAPTFIAKSENLQVS